MTTESSFDSDRALAKESGYVFRVMRKEKRGAPWMEVFADIDDLTKAMALAGEIEAYEVGILLGGMIYWTSRWPDVFNSTVIEQAWLNKRSGIPGADERS
jgi:hypothetical protein